ncbi:MAG: MoxR family ATPase [Anaerolineaceae bacterium]|nr:MoxR family ATPase [Anaerolineaceae bacterium]
MKDQPIKTIPLSNIQSITEQIIIEIEKAVIGKRDALETIMAALLSTGGHILLEDNPGLAKTLIANSFATTLDLGFKRIQFTPDLLPGDITGGYVFDSKAEKFTLRKGPIFTQMMLADEINRASPKTQSALLEAMQEYQVSLEGEQLLLPSPFIVIATQNPIESEGIFPLPEAQLDRFLIKLSIGYPKPYEEQEMLQRRQDRKQDTVALKAIVDTDTFLRMQQAVENVYVDADIEHYIVNLVNQTRLHRQVVVGASPRGSLALLKISRSWAALHGRDFIIPDDVKLLAKPVLAHRIILEPSLWGTRNAEAAIIDEILHTIPVPVITP